MSRYLGDYAYGQTVYVHFDTYNSSGASVTLTGLAVTDIEIYKNGGTTQRASDNGYTLLDTDGIDFDGITGLHGFSIDTSDNTTAGFFGPGNDYTVCVSSVTVDSQTVNFSYQFSIENRHSSGILNRTTIASLASQTSFTLTAGSADNDAYNGCEILVQDAASVVQKCIGYISDYTGSTKTVTLVKDPGIFTMATGDYVTIRHGAAGYETAYITTGTNATTMRQAINLLLAQAVGLSTVTNNGNGTYTVVFKDHGDQTTTRVTGTTDVSAQRTAVTQSPV